MRRSSIDSEVGRARSELPRTMLEGIRPNLWPAGRSGVVACCPDVNPSGASVIHHQVYPHLHPLVPATIQIPTTMLIRPSSTIPSFPPISASTDPDEDPTLRVTIVFSVETTPAPNEESVTDSGCEIGESRDVAVSLHPPAGREVRESPENGDRGERERTMLLGWLNLVAREDKCRARVSAVVQRGFSPLPSQPILPGCRRSLSGSWDW